MKNKLTYFGFLGFIGFIGIILKNPPLISFFAFFVFFSYLKVIPDELFWENVKKSALHAFIIQIIISVIALTVGSFLTNEEMISAVSVGGLSLNYVIGILVFVFNVAYYEHREKKGKV